MFGEITLMMLFLIALTWGRHFCDVIAREIRVRRRHYR